MFVIVHTCVDAVCSGMKLHQYIETYAFARYAGATLSMHSVFDECALLRLFSSCSGALSRDVEHVGKMDCHGSSLDNRFHNSFLFATDLAASYTFRAWIAC